MKILLNNTNIERQHFARVGSDMRALAVPLQSLGIEVFARIRIWSDQTVSLLTTHPSFSVLFVKEKFYEFAFAGKPEKYMSGIILLDDSLHCPKIKKIKDTFVEHSGLKLDISIIEKFDTYTDLYWFGTPCNIVNTANFYLNKIGYLKAYISSIKESAQTLFSESEQYQLIYPTPSADTTLLTSPDFHKFINGYEKPKNLYPFTKREHSCLLLLKNGLSPKEIANHLNRSPRTIEKHLINIRKKMGKESLLKLMPSLNDIFY